MNKLAQFTNEKYLSLESFKKDGTGVKTPIWFVEHEGTFFGYSLADAYKVKRIRNNPRIRVAPCDARGKVHGAWIEGRARIIDPQRDGTEYDAGQRRLVQKYGLIKRLANLFSRFSSRPRAGIVIEFD